MTYLELFNELKKINNNHYHIQVLYEFIFDEKVYNKLTFIEYREYKKNNAKKIIKKFKRAVKSNIPWERILKYTYLYNQKFILFNKVFSPRQDTEFLIHTFLNENKNLSNKTILDLGSGTGCICINISLNIDSSNKVIAYEKSKIAYKNTILNNKLLNANVQCINKDYLKLIKKNKLINADYILCNPPYINENYLLDDNVLKYDPKMALFSKKNEIKYYQIIIDYFLKSKSIQKIYFEIGYNQKEKLSNYLIKKQHQNFYFIKDYNNIDRILIINK